MAAPRSTESRAGHEADEAPSASSQVARFRRLDDRLLRAVEALDAMAGEDVEGRPYRGLYLSSDDVRHALSREPGSPRLNPSSDDPECDQVLALGSFESSSRMARLGRVFMLSTFDLAVVLIALAPEFDLKYERAYAYLQDDMSRRRPGVDLVLDLLCRTTAEKLSRRAHFAPDSPLILTHLIRLTPEPQPGSPLPSWTIRLDEQIVRYLLFQKGLDPRLGSCCRLTRLRASGGPPPGVPSAADPSWRPLMASVMKARKERQPLRLYFQGPRGSGQANAAAAIAAEADANLLTVDLGRLPSGPGSEGDEVLRVLMREVLFQGAILYVEPWDSSPEPGSATSFARDALSAELSGFRGVAILSGEKPWEPTPGGPKGVVTVPFEVTGFAVRRATWKAEVENAGILLPDAKLDALASLYKLNPEQIADAAATAAARSAIDREGDSPEPFFRAARAQSGHALARLARKVEPVHTWADLVLEPDATEQLRELCRRIENKRVVLEDWKFGLKIARSGGTSALFCGPSGTGKTTAASIVASELKLDLYEIDLSRIVSKYIGETEKNLRAIFLAAVGSNAILQINEAEALWGKRTEVRDAHDRYANIEIAFLLQEMELFEGVAILTTNLRANLDEGFTRRLDFIVEMAFPDAAARRRIWEVHLKNDAPRGELDLDLLANLRLSGGNIKNVVYAAAYLAAADGSPIETRHLVHASRRELQKLGRAVNEADFGPYGNRPKNAPEKSPEKVGTVARVLSR